MALAVFNVDPAIAVSAESGSAAVDALVKLVVRPVNRLMKTGSSEVDTLSAAVAARVFVKD